MGLKAGNHHFILLIFLVKSKIRFRHTSKNLISQPPIKAIMSWEWNVKKCYVRGFLIIGLWILWVIIIFIIRKLRMFPWCVQGGKKLNSRWFGCYCWSKYCMLLQWQKNEWHFYKKCGQKIEIISSSSCTDACMIQKWFRNDTLRSTSSDRI